MGLIADRMKLIDSSGIRKVFDLAATMKDPINLSIGQPDFDVPELFQEEAIKAIRGGCNKYTQTQGIKELITLIRINLKRDYSYEPEELFITSGVSGGLMLALLALVNPGDEVIIPDPYFVMYKHLVNLCGGKPVFCSTYPDFKVTAERIKPLVTSRTKLILLNTPSNPTGVSIDEEELPRLARLAKDAGVYVISDEIYDIFLYEGSHRSIAPLYDKVILMNGFSKSCAMTGWRVGYAAGPGEVIREMVKLQQYSFVCAPSFAQKALLRLNDLDFKPYLAAYKKKRDMIYDGLKDLYEVSRPQGAFYIFPKAPGTEGASSFVKRAIENNLLVIPGSVFSERDTHFRISFASSDKTIEKGVEVLRKLAR